MYFHYLACGCHDTKATNCSPKKKNTFIAAGETNDDPTKRSSASEKSNALFAPKAVCKYPAEDGTKHLGETNDACCNP